MRVAPGVNQLHIHANLVGRSLHTTFENVRYTELLRDLRKIIGRTFKSLGRGARNHFQVRDPGKARQDFFLDAFREICVVWVTAEILERQNGDGFSGIAGVATVEDSEAVEAAIDLATDAWRHGCQSQ